jgi:hypothetical protein
MMRNLRRENLPPFNDKWIFSSITYKKRANLNNNFIQGIKSEQKPDCKV